MVLKRCQSVGSKSQKWFYGPGPYGNVEGIGRAELRVQSWLPGMCLEENGRGEAVLRACNGGEEQRFGLPDGARGMPERAVPTTTPTPRLI